MQSKVTLDLKTASGHRTTKTTTTQARADDKREPQAMDTDPEICSNGMN
jgi:hypothetical protein